MTTTPDFWLDAHLDLAYMALERTPQNPTLQDEADERGRLAHAEERLSRLEARHRRRERELCEELVRQGEQPAALAAGKMRDAPLQPLEQAEGVGGRKLARQRRVGEIRLLV